MSKRVEGYLFPKLGSKKRHILNDLMAGASLTPMKALAYGTHRLAAVIFELKNLNGFTIAAVERFDNRGTLFTEYVMPADECRRAQEVLNTIR